MAQAVLEKPRTQSYVQSDYWRNYHSDKVLARFDAVVEEKQIMSTGVKIHMDIYAQPDKNAPVFIFNHGGGGYSRLFVPLMLALYDKGYTLICPDQRGQGLSEGNRSNFVVGQFVQNIVDVAKWARETYRGMIFLGGASLGGALTYKAAAAGAPITAMVCHNLYDLGLPHDTLSATHFAPLKDAPIVPQVLAGTMRFLGAVLPFVRIPYQALGKFDKMVDERAVGFFDTWRKDPYPIKWASLRYMASTFSTPPAIPYEDNTIPVLVINQTRDKMVSPAITRKNYDRLSGDKHYVEIDYGHWAMGEVFEQEWAGIVDDFLQQFWVK